MKKKALVMILIPLTTLILSACVSSTAPRHEGCASGYIIAYDEDGNPVCVPEK